MRPGFHSWRAPHAPSREDSALAKTWKRRLSVLSIALLSGTIAAYGEDGTTSGQPKETTTMPTAKNCEQSPRAETSACAPLDLAHARTVRIAGREWTVENLRIPWPGSWAPNGDEQLAATYGRLYTYAMALEIAARAPGWRLPTKEDVEALITAVGGRQTGAAALKAGGFSGFEALLAGFREPEDNTFRRTGKQTGFWTSTAAEARTAWKFYLLEEDEHIRFKPVTREYGDSIRLVRDK